eukprot:6196584-Pleurochrysis_carterae.AAC.3
MDHWVKLEHYLSDCKTGVAGPCFNWDAPHRGRKPSVADARLCNVGAARTSFELSAAEAPDGVLAALVSCAGRLGEALLAAQSPPSPAQSAGADTRAWGLLVLSDSPAFPSLAAAHPSLAGRVVTSDGAGGLGHSSFSKSCKPGAGCSFGADPGGAWTRSCVDFYLAGVADGFVRALFTSFLWATMRRNLLCCRPGSFVQWNAWYNLSRTHRDRPMLDRDFMNTLAEGHARIAGV